MTASPVFAAPHCERPRPRPRPPQPQGSSDPGRACGAVRLRFSSVLRRIDRPDAQRGLRRGLGVSWRLRLPLGLPLWVCFQRSARVSHSAEGLSRFRRRHPRRYVVSSVKPAVLFTPSCEPTERARGPRESREKLRRQPSRKLGPLPWVSQRAPTAEKWGAWRSQPRQPAFCSPAAKALPQAPCW